jgi:ribosomal protein S18 acetylase RimI-like enzyme
VPHVPLDPSIPPLPEGAVRVREVTDVEEAEGLVPAFARLIPQLSRSAPPPDVAVLQEIVESRATHLLLAEDPSTDEVLGSLTLCVFRIPTGLRAWIEDVVVDDAARGRGVGEALNLFAIDLAAELGCRTVDLTSRPSREAANRLYQRIGFVARETNVYRFDRDA